MQTGAKIIDVSTNIRPARALQRSIANGDPGLRVIYARDIALWDRWLAARAWSLYECGHVDLVQRRIPNVSPARFEYIAIKRRNSTTLDAETENQEKAQT